MTRRREEELLPDTSIFRLKQTGGLETARWLSAARNLLQHRWQFVLSSWASEALRDREISHAVKDKAVHGLNKQSGSGDNEISEIPNRSRVIGTGSLAWIERSRL